ncbi:MAG TPA: amino acid ABC transporter permease, partial [Kineosporiaceae bacterium]|nr:amino acid ABC transporter permease [Kineosporiaceae bacterium]
PASPGTATSDGDRTWSPSEVQRARDVYRAGRGRRSTGIAVLSTVVVLGLLVLGVTSSPGWPRVQQSFFDPEVAWAALPEVAYGLRLNAYVWLAAGAGMLVFGLLIALLRTLQGPVFWPLRALATAYVDLFRGLPVIITLYLIGFGVPGLRLQGVPSDPVVLGAIALTLTYSAYVAEVLRAGIESVHPSQRAAARSLGLSTAQTMRHVVLPQGVRRVVPPLLNDLVSLQKDAGLLSVLGPLDALRQAQVVQADYANFTPYVVAGLLFIAFTIPLTRLTDWVMRRNGFLPSGLKI